MRRSSVGSLASVFLAVIACTTETVIVEGAPPGSNPSATPPTNAQGTDASTPKTPTSDPLIVDLGAVKTGVDVAFEVPAGALGFNIVAEGKIADFDQDRPFGIERITDPAGTVVHDNFTPNGGTLPTSTAAFDTIAVAGVPQSENVPEILPAGKWKLRLGISNNPTASATLNVKVRIQSSGDGIFHGGALDLTLHVPPGLTVDNATVDATNAESNAGIRERVDTFYQVMSELLGIERGTVTFKADGSAFTDLDDNEVIQGFAASRGEENGKQNMHILLTNAIRQGGKSIALGISPGIPGSAGVFGRGTSGIIVVTSKDAEGDALTMAHEFGHFIGLNHTAEISVDGSDPLADTPACPRTTLSNQDFMSCPDRNNVMFVAGAVAGPLTLSPTQKRIYRGSPIYRAFGAESKSQALRNSVRPSPLILRHTFRASKRPLSALESELSLGFCGLNPVDPTALVKHHGYAAAVRELQAIVNDPDLASFIRGRASLALEKLGVTTSETR